MSHASILIHGDGRLERRRHTDRRSRPTALLEALRRRGRRSGFRRAGEGRNEYVDRALASTTALTTFVVVASALDAFFTLIHINRGGSEANPIMDLALSQGLAFFLAAKLAITCSGVWLLAAHQFFPLGSLALRFVTGLYVCLLAYHAVLLAS